MKLLKHLERFGPELVDQEYPTSVLLPAGDVVQVADGDSAYGMVAKDEVTISSMNRRQVLNGGMYFSIAGPARIEDLKGFVCLKHAYTCLNTFGGPIEQRGRLKYIDGCSDTLLLSPTVFGDPCLNLLYAPAGINQTAHSHPSVRVGLVIGGRGICCLDDGSRFNLDLGSVFVLPAGEVHSFHTTNASLQIVVYHPESNFGPNDSAHPMVNRTEIDGVSVAGDARYQTREIVQ
jgi:mannose-6-phosphate isomerase-like protein (cupin superfamily)